jgi:lysophospholipase L1-like esterase
VFDALSSKKRHKKLKHMQMAALGLIGAIVFHSVIVQAETAALKALATDGASIAFLGDSITQQGAGPLGYVTLAMAGLSANGIQCGVVGAGISGHKSNQMLARLARDVLEKKPTVMTLSCGVNDVWHGVRGVPLPAFQTNITAIIDQAQSAGIHVVILTATMIKEEPENEANAQLAGYNDFLRAIAAEKQCLLADVSGDMLALVRAARAAGNLQNTLTGDGVHMNPQGNRMMATRILRTLGFDDAQLARAETAWAQAEAKFKSR